MRCTSSCVAAHARTYARARIHTHACSTFLLPGHGSLIDAPSRCCQSELITRCLAAFALPDLARLWLGFSIFDPGFLCCPPMATSDGLDGCLQRGRSQSDPNILTEPDIDLAHGSGNVNASFSGYICIYACHKQRFFLIHVFFPLG